MPKITPGNGRTEERDSRSSLAPDARPAAIGMISVGNKNRDQDESPHAPRGRAGICKNWAPPGRGACSTSSPGGGSGSPGIRRTRSHQSRKRLYILRRRAAGVSGALLEQLAGAPQFVANIQEERDHFVIFTRAPFRRQSWRRRRCGCGRTRPPLSDNRACGCKENRGSPRIP